MDRDELPAKKKVMLIIALLGCVIVLGATIWSFFSHNKKEYLGGVEELDGPGEEVEYDVLVYKNLEILEDEIDDDLVATIRAELDLALIDNSALNTRTAKNYNVIFSEVAAAPSGADGASLFYNFNIEIKDTAKGDVKYAVHVMIEGNTNPEIDANYFTSLAIETNMDGFGDLVVTNNPNEDKAREWSKQYLPNLQTIIKSEIF